MQLNTDSFPNYSVGELNKAIGRLLERGFAPQFGLHATVSKSQLKNGHLWLTLTDGKSSISGVIWSSTLKKISFRPNEQDGVEILGKLNFWETRASLAVQVIAIRPTISTVLKKFEVVRKKLIQEGVINDKKRRLLPRYPSNIAILTSVPSSALADILRTSKERWPLAKIIIFPIPVQGDVVNKVKRVLDRLEQHQALLGIEAIVLARGGGSREDLMLFDDEELCRKLSALPVPLITGLGHEDDLTVADLVADHRSATPTAAIVDLLPSREVAKGTCIQMRTRLKDYLSWNLGKQKQLLADRRMKWESNTPLILIQNLRDLLKKKKALFNAFSPGSLLKRGFCVVRNQSGNVIRGCVEVNTLDTLTIELIDGYIDSRVETINLDT